jgi:hypothetical protein
MSTRIVGQRIAAEAPLREIEAELLAKRLQHAHKVEGVDDANDTAARSALDKAVPKPRFRGFVVDHLELLPVALHASRFSHRSCLRPPPRGGNGQGRA